MNERNYHEGMDKRMFDFPDFYDTVAKWLPQDAVIAECGVANGASAIYLAEALLNLGKSFKFYWIDSMAYGGDRQLRIIIDNMVKANVGQWCEIIPLSSAEASTRFPDNHFDFVFIDASHEIEATKADIRCWYPKVKGGCLLAGHDYNSNEGIEVKLAVNHCIPKEKFEVIETDANLGVWKTIKREGSLCY